MLNNNRQFLGRATIGAFATAVLLSMTTLGGVASADTPAGTLDPAFGTNGVQVSPLPDSNPANPPDLVSGIVTSLQLDSDEGIVVGGPNPRGFDLASYSSEGVLESSFGIQGFVTTGFDSSTHEMILDSSDRIIVAGAISSGSLSSTLKQKPAFKAGTNFMVARFLRNGRLDRSFGVGGYSAVQSKYSSAKFPGSVVGLRLDGLGRIEVLGYIQTPTQKVLTLARFTSKGLLDSTFGAKGVIQIANLPLASLDLMAFDRHGRIVIVDQTVQQISIRRLTSLGTVDPTFKGGPFLPVGPPTDNYISTISFDPSDRILLGGQSNTQFVVGRLTPDGKVDKTFGIRGFTGILSHGLNGTVFSIAVDDQGNIYAGGLTNPVTIDQSEFTIAKLSNSGFLVEDFGDGGFASTQLGQRSYVQTLTFDIHQNILAAGGNAPTSAAYPNFALARFSIEYRVN